MSEITTIATNMKRVDRQYLGEFALFTSNIGQELHVVVEGSNLVDCDQLRLFASLQNGFDRCLGRSNLFDLDAVAQRDLNTIGRFVEHDTGAIEQAHVLVEVDLLHGLCESRRSTNSDCTRALQAIDQTALTDVGVTKSINQYFQCMCI